MLEKITEFINELIPYDYILFGGVLVFFILFVLLGVVFRKKTLLALILIIFGFAVLIGGSTIGYVKLHDYLFSHTTSIISQKKLNFTQAVVVYATITNESKREFKSCKITATAYRVNEDKIKEYILKFKPIEKASIIEENIDINETRELKFIVEPFTYSGDYNVSLKAKCR
ncbi:MAG: hypothetical protein QG559_782 [Campylobacterota bacterium]|nr:hypothetical protein [Campylobacterota bacterium]